MLANRRIFYSMLFYRRSTSSATVYHLLRRKLKKYYIKHPGKAQRPTNADTMKESTESTRKSRETAQEKEKKNQVIKRPQCTVPTAVVCDFNDKEDKTQKEDQEEKDSDSKKLKVPTCRRRLSSPSHEDLSALNGEHSEDVGSPRNDKGTEKLGEDETDGVEKDETCSVLSTAGIEITRKDSLNYSSVEVMAVKGRRLSLNLSHISLESKVTVDQVPMKNASDKNLDEHGDTESKETAENVMKESPRRAPSLAQDKTLKSPRQPGSNTPSIGKVSLINSKIISIPLQQTKQDSPDKVTSRNCIVQIVAKVAIH